MAINLIEEAVKPATKQEQSMNELMDTKDGHLVCGYIRETFDEKCWIDGIMATIIQFYGIKGGSLYVFGGGDDGCLGIDQHPYTQTSKAPALCPPFSDNNAFQVSTSEYHMLVLDICGDVWTCGEGEDGQLGNGLTDDLDVPTKLTLSNRVISVSAGEKHSLLLFDNGWVQAFGDNRCGQIGYGDLDTQSLVPKTIEKLKKYNIVRICAAGDHSAVLTEEGDLFCFGHNLYGQCGVGEEFQFVDTPTKVGMNDKVKFVACARAHSLLITRNDLIYSFGQGEDKNGFPGRLGHGDDGENKYTPTLIEKLKQKRIKTCAGGGLHSLCIDMEGVVWAFGDNYSGQCGLSEDIDDQTTPKIIEWFIENKIKAIDCAAGARTSSVIAQDGSLYVFGKNDDHQLGLEEEKNYFTPTKLSLFDVQSVSMGNAHSAVICGGSAPRPFQLVDKVLEDSPSHFAGLKCGDLVLKFGSMTSQNYTLQMFENIIKQSINRQTPVVVKRNPEGIITLNLVPKQWGGGGLLGCKLKPYP